MLRSFAKDIRKLEITEYYDENESNFQQNRGSITLKAKWLELIRDPIQMEELDD